MSGSRLSKLLVATVLLASCKPSQRVGGNAEIVMPPGSEITARTSRGAITVRAGDDYQRGYVWGNCERSVKMWPRRERWYGSMGLYYPGPGRHWRECEGITRAVVEEGQQQFATAEEAVAWVASRRWMPFAYRNDGVVVGWTTVPEREQLNVEVWQLLVAGQRPKMLAGAADSAITTTGLP